MERRRTTPGRDPYPAASHSWSACRWPWHFSERSSGRSRLESLFLDEGFGTLDSVTLDAALNALVSSQPYNVSKYAINTPYNPTL